MPVLKFCVNCNYLTDGTRAKDGRLIYDSSGVTKEPEYLCKVRRHCVTGAFIPCQNERIDIDFQRPQYVAIKADHAVNYCGLEGRHWEPVLGWLSDEKDEENSD